MTVSVAHLGLGIDSPLVTPAASNFRPPTWPPPNDFPVVLDTQGNVVCRYCDCVWDLSLWAGQRFVLTFDDGPQIQGLPGITSANEGLLKQIAAWWLWGPKPIRKLKTLMGRFTLMRQILMLCSREGIVASDLKRFPGVAGQLPKVIAPSYADSALTLLHTLYEQREELGFSLLDREGLSRLAASLPKHAGRQTPYIPPRIWCYQVNRLRAFLDDFQAHRGQIEACFHFCLDAYAQNFGTLPQAFGKTVVRTNRLPFGAHVNYTGEISGFEYHGGFELTARRFGIDGVLERWCFASGGTLENLGIRSLSTYFSMVCAVGMAYLLSFSLMRIEEAWKLRTDCLEIERDEKFGSIYILRGETSKTALDSDARWPTSPSVKVAVDSMSCIARLRMICAQKNPYVEVTDEDICNPYLAVRVYEPWTAGKDQYIGQPFSVRKSYPSYTEVISRFRSLFDPEELRITEADVKIARLINPDLAGDEFSVGKVWPLAWHQLRRTGAVNMQASGLVSDASLQYQLKHVTRSMSLYYGQGYSRLAINDEARILYLRTIYEILGKEFASLLNDRYVSPYGDKRKAEILKLVDPADHKKLTALARSGKVSWRETLLGGCAKRGPCPYGGVDNITRCGGGDGGAPCVDVLYDREKGPYLNQLSRVIASRMEEAPDESPYLESLKAQQRALENALDVIEPK